MARLQASQISLFSSPLPSSIGKRKNNHEETRIDAPHDISYGQRSFSQMLYGYKKQKPLRREQYGLKHGPTWDIPNAFKFGQFETKLLE